MSALRCDLCKSGGHDPCSHIERDTLREMVSREMRGYIGPTPSYPIPPSDMDWIVDRAVDVTLRLLGKWGHAPHCACHDDGEYPQSTECYQAVQDYGPHTHQFCDPRCAQPGGGEHDK